MQTSTSLGLLVSLSSCLIFVQAAPVENAADAKSYLQRFNHMGRDNMMTGEFLTEEDYMEGISSFQSMANLTVTGVLDEETMDMMNMDRCGVPDNMGHSNSARRKRYSAMTRWPITDLTWRINSYSPDLVDASTRQIMEDALKLWSDVSQLTFTETAATDADLIIDFNTGDHGDGSPFDGPGRVLAHAYFPIPSTIPSIAGDAHFDDDESFTENTNSGINLFQVAAHEFGHSLGLGHSDDPNALMYAFYRGYIPNFQLPQDDINGIQYLYGENSGAPDQTMKPFNPPDDRCPSQLDTIVRIADGRTFAFAGDLVYELAADGVVDGYPRQISQVFAGLPNDIDAAFFYERNGKTYFFKGDQYYRYSSTTADAGYPRYISDWPGLPANIDSAFVWSGNGRVYFTKGNQYYRYNVNTNRIDDGYPRPLSVWGLPVDSVDTAQQWSNSRTYFYSGDVYYRFNDANFVIDDTYPRPTAYWWFGCGENDLQQMTTDNMTEGCEGGGLPVALPSTLALLLSAALALFHLM